MNTKSQHKTYPIERSPLWQLRSQKKLAGLLGLSKAKFKLLVTEREFHYRAWSGETDGKKRDFAVPVGPMRPVHERLKNLLSRIEKPPYLYSPRTGYSPIQNATLHSNATRAFKIDIKQFYPSTTREHVFRFFLYRLHMSEDAAGALAKLATFDGKAAFGSPLSPILCFLAHQDIFDKIENLCMEDNDDFSLWVDDITVSGAHVSGDLVYRIKQQIESKGLQHHKEVQKHISSGMIVTGTFVESEQTAPANKHHLKLRDKLNTLDQTQEPAARLKLINSLIGMTNSSLAMYSINNPARERALKRKQWLNNEQRALTEKLELIYTQGTQKAAIPIPDGSDAPWL